LISVERSPAVAAADVLALQRLAGNQAVSAWLASGRRGPAVSPTGRPVALQRKLEFANHYAVAPQAAKAAVKSDQAGYEEYQRQFELKLGTGLHANPAAMQGADALLLLMQAAMTRAGFTQQQQSQSFGVQPGQASVDLGSVLVSDVGEALAGGNLREKMGMVYQARFRISEALNTLRKDVSPEAQNLIGDEMKSAEMGQAIGQAEAPAYAILKRRDSVIAQNKLRGQGQMRALLSDQDLSSEGVGLSEREKRAAPTDKGGARRFVPGREFYTIPPNVRQAEQDNLRLVAAGLSGSTDMYFRIAKHLKMDVDGRRKLRLAALGQMLANRDHSFHEIMHVAKTQGELTDYPDELPIGYTRLQPLDSDQILATAGLTDFPGDAQIREVGVMQGVDTVKATAGDHSKRSKTYPAVLNLVRAYGLNPTKANLEAIVAGTTSWIDKKKPGRFSRQATRDKYNRRAPVLAKVKAQAEHLLDVWNRLSTVPPAQLTAFVRQSMESGDVTARARMGRLADVGGEHENWYSPQFQAQTSDIDLDTSSMTFAKNESIGVDEPINANLVTDISGFVDENRLIMETLGKDVSGIPRIAPAPTGIAAMLAKKKLATEQQAIRDNPAYKTDVGDFTNNIDTSVLDALSPTAPVGGFLKRFEGKPVPQELQAINAYAQPGFYTMMNDILNKRADKAYMATAAGKKWWDDVPIEAKKLISLSVSAVRKMQPYAGGVVYRGENMISGSTIRANLSKPKAAREAAWRSAIRGTTQYDQFVSTSKRPYSSYIVKPGKYTAVHITTIKSGVDISAFSNTIYEREVLFPPGARFTVTSVDDKFTSATEPGNRYSDAPIPSDEPGRIKVTLDEL
jgi:hypothetical protein